MSRMTAMLEAGAPPVVAILRGVRPDEVVEIAAALIDSGLRFIEVPLNSPEPFDSIAALVETFAETALIGAGTVTDTIAVDRLVQIGAELLVMPNTDAAVIARGVGAGLEAMPGFATPSEAFAAILAGARRLKLFPAGVFGPAYLKAIREILPPDIETWAVGGAGADNFAQWQAAGAHGIGVGGGLYRPGDNAKTVGGRGRALVDSWQRSKA